MFLQPDGNRGGCLSSTHHPAHYKPSQIVSPPLPAPPKSDCQIEAYVQRRWPGRGVETRLTPPGASFQYDKAARKSELSVGGQNPYFARFLILLLRTNRAVVSISTYMRLRPLIFETFAYGPGRRWHSQMYTVGLLIILRFLGGAGEGARGCLLFWRFWLLLPISRACVHERPHLLVSEVRSPHSAQSCVGIWRLISRRNDSGMLTFSLISFETGC